MSTLPPEVDDQVTAAEGMATSGGLEIHAHDYVPLNERHGKARSLFYLWFGENMTIFALVTGALAVVLGLNFWWAIVSIVVGTLLGSLIMAFHSAQGPTLGLPQMIQSRAQFGYYGAILPTVIAWFMYIAFTAVAIVICGQSFQSVWGGSLTLWMIVSAIPIAVLAVVGYDMIHFALKYLGLVFAIFFGILTIMLIQHGIPMESLNKGGFSWAPFLASTAIMATWNAGYAPYVSDYSRYLPPDQVRGTFWFTYLGTTISTILMMILGAAVTSLAPDLAVAEEIRQLGGGTVGAAMVIIMAIGLIIANPTNIYGGMITTFSIADNIRPFQSTARLRVFGCAFIAVLSTLAAVWGAGDFATNLQNFFFILLYFLIPWSMINLIDFFFIRHGSYSIKDFFLVDGAYGKWGWLAITVYFIGFLCQLPFINTVLYVGPIANAMNGADIAWIVGVVVTIPLYYFLAKRQAARRAALAPEASSATAETR
jgi:nucleobase:cation symporter-1, NCS1 family